MQMPHKDGVALENAIGGKLAVWVGAIALALGGVFLVKLSIEQGMLPNELRVLGGLILGIGLGGVAWRLRDRSNYVAQGLAAAAVIDIYACLWAGVDLYQLIPPWLALVGMVFTTLLAVGLALRLGSLVAIIGLLGAFLAPLLVGRQDPSPIGLFSYLLALQAGCQFLARRRRWVWASGISLGAGALWVIVHLVSGGAHMWPGLFLLASTTVFVMPELLKPSAGKGSEIAVWAAAAIGTLLLALTLGVSSFEPQMWLFFGVLVAGTGVLALWQQRYAKLPLLTFAVTLILTGLQLPHGGWSPQATLALAIGLGGLFAAISYTSLWRPSGRNLFPLVIAAPAAFVFVAMPKLGPAFDPVTWMYILLSAALVYWAMFVPVMARRDGLDRRYVAWLLMPAMALTAAAWPFGLELHWCVILWALQLAGAFALDRRFGVESARWCGLALVGAMLVCLVSPIVLLVAQDIGKLPLLNWTNAAYVAAIAACLFARRLQSPESYSRSFTSVSTVLLVLGWAALNIHHAANQGTLMTTHVSALEVSAHVATMLVMSLWLIWRAPHARTQGLHAEALHLRGFGLGLGMLATFVGALLLATAGNPWVRHDVVRGAYLFNSILVGVGVPALLMGMLACVFGIRGFTQQRLAGWHATGAMIVLLTMLEVRHLFHGAELWVGPAGQAEHYAYSLALALLAMLALGLGMRRGSRQLRVIALLGMLACSIKVFGYDMRELQGMYRVLSFLGLGASLMALGYIYNRFGPKPRPRVEPQPEPPEIPPQTAPMGQASRAVLEAYLEREGKPRLPQAAALANQDGLFNS
jgi:uncharacterized membrane protein